MPRKGSKRKKTRTHVESAPQGVVMLDRDNKPVANNEAKVPRSIVARGSKVYGPVKVLIHDLRKLMEPYTAVKLKERSFNRMKDYVSVAGVLDITHILTVSQTVNYNIILKIARHPSGPTLSFRVNHYTLSGQVKAFQKKPYDSSKTFATPPVVVLNNFGQSSENHVQVMKVMFQNMLPTIDIKTVKLTNCRRVVLFHHRKEDGMVEMRHYAIRATPVGISRSVKKIIQRKVPNLGELEDVSQFMEGRGLSAMSDSEAEDEDARVVLPQTYVGKGNSQSQQSAMKLVELGPRLTLELVKVESGVGEGEVLYHKYVHKTVEEAAALKKRVEGERKLKEERRKQQEENVKRKREIEDEKRKEKLERKRRKYDGITSTNDDDSNDADESVNNEDEDSDFDAYPEEISEEKYTNSSEYEDIYDDEEMDDEEFAEEI